MNDYVNDFNESVKIYYKELDKCKPLSKEEERKLLLLAKKGDVNAKNTILKSNLRFVFNMAKKYKGLGVPVDELISEGNMGMVRAMEKFNMEHDVKFFSYAVWWIRQYMQACIKRTRDTNSIEKGEDEINGCAKDNCISDSEDDVINKNETIMSNEEEEDRKEREAGYKVVVDSLLVKLDGREKLIIEKYYGLNGNKEKNLEEIGDILGISKERVRQVKASSLKKMRSEILLMENAEFLFR